ncbi:S8 family serine peptidase [Salinivirga cyanobacteriivorans]
MKNFFTLVITGLIMLSLSSHAQTQKEKEQILKATQVNKLLDISKRLEAQNAANRQKALKLAKEKGWIIQKETGQGFMELQGVSENGKPLYYITNNADAAESVSTNEVWSGGSAGLNLDGTGMLAGEWDGGDVLTTHQEFNNTGSSRVTDKDGVSSTHYHATHVAGTIIAGGVEAAAMGMAYNAALDAYDWDYDESEMAAAAADGLLISNHSYGFSAGWTWNGSSWEWYGDESISSEEDYQFGFYSSYTAEIDNIALNAPYYLICKAAGNDRGDGATQTGHPQDGGADGYDCIGYKGNAKNILTVGATRDVAGGYSGNPADVEMTSFSSWGPTDDGRIKPDISGNGYNLYSTYDGNNSDYNAISGTSMATPNVTGSLLLLQEHYNENYGGFMKAATLKALAIHTADETGPNDGPDYMFGWGLLNTESAAKVITDKDVYSFIKEESLTDGATYTLEVTAAGTEPLVATIVWADPAGTPVPAQLDPTDVMLVNDLDMTIDDGTTNYYPWKLDGQNPANAATTGDNNVDNVEKVYIASPTAGTYTITINHDGTITDGPQNFSLIVSGISNGYATVNTGAVSNITKTSADIAGEVLNDNGSAVTERGFVYNTTGSPTTADTKVQVGSGTGSFSTTISGLTQGTTYYVNTYAINTEGTAYGTARSFTTLKDNIFYDGFETDKGWTFNDEWERGAPQAEGGVNYGNPDPGVAFSGSNILGLDLSGYGSNPGDYEPSLADREAYAYSPVINCSNYTNVGFEFQRWLNIESPTYDHAYIDISTDGGSTWTEIWTNTAGIEDATWNEITLDISSYADGASSVQIRFSIGETDSGWQYSGWNIDEFYITGVPVYSANFTVTDNNDGHPITGANIAINSSILVTNSSGEATIDLPDGTYSYSITKNGYRDTTSSITVNGSTVNENVALTPFPPLSFDHSITNVTCNGGTDGIITISNISGGSGSGYQYSSDGGSSWQTETMFTGLSASDYNLQVKDDANNYSSITTVSITEPAAITFDVAVTDVSVYGGSDGAIDINNLAGGSGSYQYSIDDGANWSSSSSFTDLTAGEYIILVRDLNDCLSDAVTAVVNQPPPPEYTVTFNVTDADDSHAIDGATIEINNTTITTDTNGEATINLPDNDYPYTANKNGYEAYSGNVAVSGADITENIQLTPYGPITFDINSTNVSCYGGSDGIIAIESAQGGSGSGYMYSIDGGTTWHSNYLFENLAPGSYDIQVKDGEGNLSVIITRSIVEPNEVTFTWNATDVSSNGGSDGEIEFTNVSGGYAPYEYSIDEGTTWQGSELFTGLAAGTFSLVVRDANGCLSPLQTVTITEPPVETYTVLFVVMADGHPTDAASIDINSTTIDTNTDGEATIDLPDGTYTYTVTLDGYEDITGSVTVAGSDHTENITFVGINDIFPQGGALYPNPTTGIVQIEWAGQCEVTVLNALGKIITTKEVNQQATLNLSSASEGIYLVRIKADNEIFTKRLIINR